MTSPKNCARRVMHEGRGPFVCERDEGNLTRVQSRTGVEWYCRQHAETAASEAGDPYGEPYVEVTCDCGVTTLVVV